MDSEKEALQVMFTRPCEPIFMPKGTGSSTTVFEVPESYIQDRFRPMVEQVKSQFDTKNAQVVDIKNVNIPDLSVPLKLKRTENFTLFYPKHRQMAAKLIDIFMQQRSVQDLLSLAAYCRDRINPYLFNYALSVAILHRKDTKDIPVPNFLEVFPGKFVDSGVFSQARQEASVVPQENRQPIILAREFTANEKEPEQLCAYFREDLGINLHHWHWHLVYPTDAADRSIVGKDRRGELFYYMHEQVLARYAAERLANDLPLVKGYSNFRESIPEAYFPKLEMQIASRSWPPRFNDCTPKDIDRTQDEFTLPLSEFETWQKHVKEAIDKGHATGPDGKAIALTEHEGIDILGNMIEASVLSPNGEMYGSLHNIGHVFVAICHDADGRYLENFSVMGDTATAMRDPIFYRWHTYINDLFTAHKVKLPAYPLSQLEYKNVTIVDVSITSTGRVPNQLNTFWEQNDVDLSRGMDFSPRGPIKVRFTHLQHAEFNYNIKVKNNTGAEALGTVRIFMAPKCNSNKALMPFNEQRNLMIELDKFKTTLKKGDNVITRKSIDSSVTIPFERTFRSLDASRPTDSAQLTAFNFCGCGWPQHMMIPRGTTAGMPFELFVMISNYNDDKVEQDITGLCNDADSYCGIQDKKYPDKRPMGYPFDRVARTGVTRLSNFLTSNMKVKDVSVKFSDQIVVKTVPAPVSVVHTHPKK